MHDILTPKILAVAISKKCGFSETQSKIYADIIMDIFGYENRIADNFLNPDERKLFYFLQREKIILADRENTILPTRNETWTLHYWTLNKKKIKSYYNSPIYLITKPVKKIIKKNNYYENIYFSLSDEVWKKHFKI